MPESSKTRFFRDVSTMARKMRTRFDARATDLGVTQSRARLLLLLARCDGANQAFLAEALDVERPTLARLLDGLEENGLVRREVSPEDRRQRNVFLTEAARSQVEDILNLTDNLRDDILVGIPEEDLEVAHRVILSIIENLHTLEQS